MPPPTPDRTPPSPGLPRSLFEAHLTVVDLPRSVAFYRDVVGLPLALEVPERDAAFLWIGGPGRSMLGLWSIGSAPLRLESHVAFELALDEVLGAVTVLRDAGVQPLSFFGEPTEEPSVIAWMPAAAVYFRDPDGHLLEYLAMLDDEPQGDLGILGWSSYQERRRPSPAFSVREHTGPRGDLRPLFELAEDSQQQLDAYLEDGRVLVAVKDGNVIGHLQLTDAGGPGQAEIKNMAVDPRYERRGVGRALVTAAITMAQDDGRRELVVATAAADIGNLRFYQRLGFRLREIERDAFTPATGYAAGIDVDGIALRDRVWLDLPLDGSSASPGRS